MNLPKVTLVGVKNGVETPLGEVLMPPSMRAREILKNYGYTDFDDVMSMDSSALAAMEDLIAYCKKYYEQQNHLAALSSETAG